MHRLSKYTLPSLLTLIIMGGGVLIAPTSVEAGFFSWIKSFFVNEEQSDNQAPAHEETPDVSQDPNAQVELLTEEQRQKQRQAQQEVANLKQELAEVQAQIEAEADTPSADSGQAPQPTITDTTLDELQALEERLRAEIQSAKDLARKLAQNNLRAIGLTGRIDNLSGTTFNDAEFTGTVTGLTDAHIPNDITASNYLSKSGGTLTGALTGTDLTLTGSLTGTSATFSGTLTAEGGTTFSNLGTDMLASINSSGALTATSTPTASHYLATSTTATSTFANGLNVTSGCVSVNGSCLGGASTFLSLSDTQSSFNQNRIPFTNSAADALTDNANFVFDGTNLGVGASSPSYTLTVSGDSQISGLVDADHFVATSTTATSTFAWGIQTTALDVTSTSATSTFANGISFANGGIEFSDGSVQMAAAGGETANQIAAFASSCPSGWSEYTSARGRTIVGTPNTGTGEATVGSALSDQGTRTITDVPAHTHSVDPPSTETNSDTHNHSVDPPSTNTNTTGAHTHRFKSTGSNCCGFDDVSNKGSYATGRMESAGNHSHSVNIPAFNSASDTHSHSVDIASFDSASTGSASVDVTMPYIQLTWCQKNSGADYAEWIDADSDIQPGTIVSAKQNGTETVTKSAKAYDPAVVGIVSTKPGWIIGEEKEGRVQLALSGRVPVTVTLANGAIKPGDPITTADIEGVGMKATKRGPIVGKALQSLNERSPELFACRNAQTGATQLCGTITVLVNVSWYDPVFALQDEFTFKEDGTLHVRELVADTVRSKQFCSGSTCIGEEELKYLRDKASNQ